MLVDPDTAVEIIEEYLNSTASSPEREDIIKQLSNVVDFGDDE